MWTIWHDITSQMSLLFVTDTVRTSSVAVCTDMYVFCALHTVAYFLYGRSTASSPKLLGAKYVSELRIIFPDFRKVTRHIHRILDNICIGLRDGTPKSKPLLPCRVFWGNLPASELLVPTFRNILPVPSSYALRLWRWNWIESSETSVQKLRRREITPKKTQYGIQHTAKVWNQDKSTIIYAEKPIRTDWDKQIPYRVLQFIYNLFIYFNDKLVN